MQPHDKPLQPILCLIDGYLSAGGDGEVEAAKAHFRRNVQTMREHAGRWCLVGEVRYVNRREIRIGSEPRDLQKAGLEVETVNGKVYARVPHPSGRPLSDFVERKPQARRGDELPTLKSYRWSKDEINDAITTARAWLFQGGTQVA